MTKKKTLLIDSVFSFILFAFPFLRVNTGVDFSDTLYSIGNYNAFPHFNKTWMIATLLSNAIGKVMSTLPGGGTLLGISIYCCTLISILIVILYFLVRFFFDPVSSFGGLFIGILFCWCPRTILYNHASCLIFDIATLVLIIALIKRRNSLCVLAGSLLALNTFIRFPNIAEISLILVVFAYAFLYKKDIRKELISCFLSYILTFLTIFLVVECIWGQGSYFAMIQGLIGMTDTAPDYKSGSMFIGLFEAYRDLLKWFLLPGAIVLLLGLIYPYCKSRFSKTILVIAEFGLLLAVLRLLFWHGILLHDYSDKNSVYACGVFLVFVVFIVSVISFFDYKCSKEEKLLGVAILIITFITPLGSNNLFYSMLNNMYLVSAFVIHYVIKSIKALNHTAFGEAMPKHARFHTLPIKVSVLFLCLVSLFQGLLFFATFVYCDDILYSENMILIRDDDILYGMRTNETNYKIRKSVKDFILDNLNDSDGIIVYGSIPGIQYFTNIPRAISHTWPDLGSYPIEDMKRELNDLAFSDAHPIIVCSWGTSLYFNDDSLAGDSFYEKTKILKTFMDDNGYSSEPIFQNDWYLVYTAEP